ncbi:MAG: hypothetical protein DCO96_01360 [Fluviicola sp. XM-24bin1]|nr:MAG: hypothetical protein DCO96_01360 [Fluviicola sp. XM-24bin1]
MAVIGMTSRLRKLICVNRFDIDRIKGSVSANTGKNGIKKIRYEMLLFTEEGFDAQESRWFDIELAHRRSF